MTACSQGTALCRTTGTLVCDGPDAVICSATKADCGELPEGCTEVCDGQDNDCDGSVDETYLSKGLDSSHFVRPKVVKIAADRWIFAHEASRPDAGLLTAGTGNGYHCLSGGCPLGVPATPIGTPLDGTLACSAPDRLPWFGVSPAEAEQTCAALGGFLCTEADWRSACQVGANARTWGYAPAGDDCKTPAAAGIKECNLAPFGVTDEILSTASPSLSFCWASWLGLFSNPVGEIRDLTGNLREIADSGSGQYALLGGSFLTRSETAASCSFESVLIDDATSRLDAGFRCCFDTDPTL